MAFRPVALVASGAVLLAIVAIPLALLLISSFKPKGVLPFESSVLTLSNYIQVFGSTTTYRLILNTFEYGAGSLALGMVMATLIAWLVERTNMPFGNLVFGLMFIPLAIPGLITALGYGLLLNPRNGIINSVLGGLGGEGLQHSLTAYSLSGMIFVTALDLTQSMFIVLSSVMRNMDPNLEEAAAASGAGIAYTLSRITGPLMRPGLLSAMGYFGVVVIETFEVPLLLGVNGGVPVLSVQIYQLVAGRNSLPSYGLASTYSLVTLVAAVGLIAGYSRATRNAQRFQIISGRAYRAKRVDLGTWKWIGLGFVVVFVLLKVVLPLAVLL